MRKAARQHGFSLTEVLLATGVLAVGFALIATVFPVGIKLTTTAAERTIGPVAADEAAAKVRLYGLDLRDPVARGGRIGLRDTQMRVFDRDILSDSTYQHLIGALPDGLGLTNDDIDARLREDAFYPSLPEAFYMQNTHENRQYCWRTLCMKSEAHNNPQNVYLWTFVCRKTGQGGQYYGFTYDSVTDAYVPVRDLDWPMPIPVAVVHNNDAPDVLVIDVPNQRINFTIGELGRFFTDDARILDEVDGDVYRILERRDEDGDGINEILVLDEDVIKPGIQPTDETIWVVPPALGSGRNPCIGIYPQTIWIE